MSNKNISLIPQKNGNLGEKYNIQTNFWALEVLLIMNFMKLVIPLHSLHWSIHIKDESKLGTASMVRFDFGIVVSQHRLESFFMK